MAVMPRVVREDVFILYQKVELEVTQKCYREAISYYLRSTPSRDPRPVLAYKRVSSRACDQVKDAVQC